MKIVQIEHMERVEGHGGVTVSIEERTVKEVKFYVHEGPRLIERLVLGKTPQEVLNLAPRICAICSISHRYAALRALENALSVQVTRRDMLLRELMHMGEMIESHALHVFLLSLPDITGHTSAIAMAPDYENEVKTGLALKKFGNRIMEVVSGRTIHGENPVLGGFGAYPINKDLLKLKQRAAELLECAIDAGVLINELKYPECPESETVFAALYPGEACYEFTGDEIVISDGTRISVQDYEKFATEFIVDHSYAKHSLYNNHSYTVGALARINVLGERLTGEAGALFKKYYTEAWKRNPFYTIPAQALEIIYSLERATVIIDELLEMDKMDTVAIPGNKVAEGGSSAGAVEAPRGTLIHYYELAGGKVTSADIVTPTAQNAEDIERYCYLFAQWLLDNDRSAEIEQTLRKVVRAFDPCISCSVH
jgi:sulfhydrogenase subunit alpha